MNPLMNNREMDNTDLFIADMKRLVNPEARIREILDANPNLRMSDSQQLNEALMRVAKNKGIDLNRVYAILSGGGKNTNLPTNNLI